MRTPIPAWANRVVPPFRTDPTTKNCSPYVATTLDLLHRFGHSPERVALLQKLVAYRADLLAEGIDGWQWIDGSFVEEIEQGPRKRPPADIDIMTFVLRPPGLSDVDWMAKQSGWRARFFAGKHTKPIYGMDAYSLTLEPSGERFFARELAYWFRLFSHSKDDGAQKGIVEVVLSATDDAMFTAELNGRSKP